MTTCEQFLDILSWVRKCGRVCGADIFAPDFRFTWVTRTVIFLCFFFYVMTAYSAYDGYVNKGDVNLMLQAFCMLGSAISGLCKLLTAVYNIEDCRQMIRNLINVYRVYEQKHIGYKDVLNSSVNLISKVLKITALVYAIGVLFLVCAPVLLFFIYGKFILLMQIILPGIDVSSASGYIVTTSYQILCVTLGAFGNFAGDLLFFIYVLHVPMLKNILRVKFEDLNGVLLNNRKSNKTLVMLQDIVHWHQEYSSYTRTMSEVYFAVTLTQVYTTALSIATTVFITFFGNWPSSPGYLVYCFSVLYAYCVLGTVIEVSNDRVCDYIYNTCLWYELSASERKMLVVMLMKAQKPTVMTVGDIMPLSVVAALSVTKAIYSFMMMLINFTRND